MNNESSSEEAIAGGPITSMEATRKHANVAFSLRYRDAYAAIAWLEQAFGFTTQAVYQDGHGQVAHAQLVLGDGLIMISSLTGRSTWAPMLAQPDEIDGRETMLPYLFVTDASSVYRSAVAAGAEMVQDLAEMPYGGKAFGCRDLEGHLWSIGEYDPWPPSAP